MTLREAMVRLHRWAGLAMAGFLFLAGLTGSIIAFDSELDGWLNPELFTARSHGPPLSPSGLVARVEAAEPRIHIVYVPIKLAPGESARLGVAPRENPETGKPYRLGFNQLFADPATGEILGTRQGGAFSLNRKNLIPFLYKFHHTLHMPGRWGVWLLGAVSILWLFDCFLGFYLTLPRGRPFFLKWRPAWKIKRAAGAYRLNFDLHRAGGLWFWVVLFALALSSIKLNLDREIFRPVVEIFSPVTPSLFEARRPHPVPVPDKPALSFTDLVERASVEADTRGWPAPSAIFHARRQGFYAVIFRPYQYRRGTGLGSPILYFDDMEGTILEATVPGEGTAGDTFSQIQIQLHSGEIAGLPGRILVSFAGIVVAILSLTGVIIWWKKRNGRRKRSRAMPA